MAKATARSRKLVAAVDTAQARLAAKIKAAAAPKASMSAAQAAAKVNGSAVAASLRRRLERLSSVGRVSASAGRARRGAGGCWACCFSRCRRPCSRWPPPTLPAAALAAAAAPFRLTAGLRQRQGPLRADGAGAVACAASNACGS